MNEQDILQFLKERRGRVRPSEDREPPPQAMAYQAEQAITHPGFSLLEDRLQRAIADLKTRHEAVVKQMLESPLVGDDLTRLKVQAVATMAQMRAFRSALDYLPQVLQDAKSQLDGSDSAGA